MTFEKLPKKRYMAPIIYYVNLKGSWPNHLYYHFGDPALDHSGEPPFYLILGGRAE